MQQRAHIQTSVRVSHDTLAGRALALAGVLVLLLAAPAMAQLKPERLYYGIDRQIPMLAEVPSEGEGGVAIRLYRAGEPEPIDEASVAPGRVDLASLFPSLWDTEEPELLYAQLAVGGDGVGASVVLQPMVSPIYYYTERGGLQRRATGDTYSGIRAYVDRHAVMETSMGEIAFRLRPDQAPNTAWNFRHLAEGGFYTDVIFHRIIGPSEGRAGFVVQGGDPTGTGTGGPGYMIDLEPSQLPHDFGVLSMARSGDPNSNGSQVFICLSRERTVGLDGNYTAFAEAVSGGDVIRKLGRVETAGGQNRPVDPPIIESVRMVDAPPFGQQPDPVSASPDEPPAR